MSALEIIRRHYAASARGDVPAMVADFDENIVWKEADGFLTAGVYTGPDEIIAGVFAPTAETWDNFAAVPGELLQDGDRVIMIGNYSGRHRVTGKPLDIRTVHSWTVRDGKIIAFEQICDSHPAQLAAQA